MDDLESLARESVYVALRKQLPGLVSIDGPVTLTLDGREYLIEVSCFDITEGE